MEIKNISGFAPDEVQVTDAYIKNALEKELAYLESFDADRLLSGFVKTAGMKPKAEVYGGWENTEIRGHSMGHYLTAISQAVAQTKDGRLAKKLEYIVDGLSQAQLESGYLSAFPETLFDNVENKKPAWVPWYTMDKILAGLIAAYRFTGNEKALCTAKKLGDWIYERTSRWTRQTQDTVLAVEYGGMNETLYDLYKITKSDKHCAAAHMFDELSLFEELEKGNDILNGKHANTTIPKILGAIYRYVALGCREEDEFYFRTAARFFDMVLEHHSYVTGGNSEWEHFGEPYVLDAERTNCNCETCNTYNMLKLARELFSVTGEKKYLNYYENTFLNAILSSQNPKTGMTTYFQPMATGFFKVYSTPFDSFWCCTGTGMENFTKCNDSIYFSSQDTIYVSQYISSVLTASNPEVKIIMESALPDEGRVKITVENPKTAVRLALRIPEWTDEDMEIITDMDVEPEIGDDGYAYITADKTMTVELLMPMHIEAYPLADNKNCIALKYGPMVLSAQLGFEDMEESKTGVDVTIATCNIPMKDFITVKGKNGADSTAQDVKNWIADIENNVVKTEGKTEFHLVGTDRDDLVFTPHYRQHEQRYGIYWNMVAKDSKELQNHIKNGKNRARLERVAIDSVPLGNDQYELLHNIKGENTGAGTFNGLMLRHAWSESGWFSYDMKVKEGINNYILVKYFSGNVGRTFNIYVDDTLLAEETIKDKNPGDFYDEYYLIPAKHMAGKTTVNVKFAVRGDSWVGGVFDRLSIVSDYDNNPNVKEISFKGAIIDKEFDETVTQYSLTAEGDNDKFELKLTLGNENGLAYVNGVLIDDTEEREIDMSTLSQLVIKSVAEDFMTDKTYIFDILKK